MKLDTKFIRIVAERGELTPFADGMMAMIDSSIASFQETREALLTAFEVYGYKHYGVAPGGSDAAEHPEH